MSKETTYSDNNKKNTENTKDSVKDFIESGSKAISGDNIKEIASKIVDDISDFLDNKKYELGNAKSKCKEHIKNNPFLVVFASFVIGALLSLLFKK